MICVQLIGGLGNQMFQYACGRALAAKHQTDILLDGTIINVKIPRQNYTVRYYELDIFPIRAKLASENQLSKFRPSLFYKITRKFRKLGGLPIKINPSYLVEEQLSYNETINKASSNCCITGYWQSERYFKTIEQIIRQEFTFQLPLDNKNEEIANRVGSTNSVSIHIRRGDYVTSAHALCSLAYYQNAIEYFGQQIVEPVFYIFSDDPEWVNANLIIKFPTEIVMGNIGKQSYVDMQLMSLCRHNIIANSSFSWWGAWLNSNPDKIVVAPKQWFTDDGMNAQTADLTPEAWIRL